MYNGIGLTTVRGSGTNGYVQTNRAFVRASNVRQATSINTGSANRFDDLPRQRQANEEILEHQRKRKVEVKVLELREAMEERGYSEREIEEKCSEVRAQLRSVSASAAAGKDSHAAVKQKDAEMARMKEAFGISNDFVEGESIDFALQEQRRQERKTAREEKDRQRELDARRREKEERRRLREQEKGPAKREEVETASLKGESREDERDEDRGARRQDDERDARRSDEDRGARRRDDDRDARRRDDDRDARRRDGNRDARRRDDRDDEPRRDERRGRERSRSRSNERRRPSEDKPRSRAESDDKRSRKRRSASSSSSSSGSSSSGSSSASD